GRGCRAIGIHGDGPRQDLSLHDRAVDAESLGTREVALAVEMHPADAGGRSKGKPRSGHRVSVVSCDASQGALLVRPQDGCGTDDEQRAKKRGTPAIAFHLVLHFEIPPRRGEVNASALEIANGCVPSLQTRFPVCSVLVRRRKGTAAEAKRSSAATTEA